MFVKYSASMLIILSTMLLLSTSTLADSSWFWQHPYPTGSDINGIQFIDNDNGWLVTSRGEVLGTKDGGVTWEELYKSNKVLERVCFINDSEGWVCGASGIVLRTSDNGQNWDSSNPTNTDLLSIEFLDENIGTITGSSGKIMRTIDGGDSWQLQGSGTTGWLYDVSFLDLSTGWVTGGNGGYVLNTVSAGAFWTMQDIDIPFSGMYKGIHFINELTGYTVGGKYIVATNDGGLTWAISHEEFGEGFTDIDFSENLSIVSGEEGVAVSEDAGTTWTYDTMPAVFEKPGYSYIQAATVPTDSRAIVAGNYGFIYSRNVSGDWSQLSSHQALEDLTSITHIGDYHVWACGNAGLIMSSTDGGANWNTQSFNEDYSLMDVCFPSVLIGYCVGFSSTSPVILKTVDGGVSWSEITPSSSSVLDLRSVDFMNENIGVAVGSDGGIIYTTDGGALWTAKNGLTTYSLNCVQFSNTDRGWAGGENGTILCFDFNSDSWSEQQNGTSYDVKAIFALNADSAWAVGEHGLVLRTQDTGSFWEVVDEKPGQDYSDVWFSSNGLDGYFAGQNFGVTSDGGFVITHPSTYSLESSIKNLSMVDLENGWGCGPLATILRFSEDPTSIEEFNHSVTPGTQMNMLTSPNPFTSSSTVSFTLPGERFVSIDLYDIVGRKVQSIQSASLPGGEHNILVNGENLSPGLYFVRLNAGGVSETRTMVRVP